MSAEAKMPTGATFAGRIATFYAALFVMLGVQLPFLPVWLAAKGLEAGVIGLVLAIPMVVRPFAIPLAGHVADRHEALRSGLIVVSCAAAVGLCVMGLAGGPVVIMAAYALTSVFLAPIMPLADAYALRGLAGHGRAYGPVRLWGSAAFIVGTLGAGLLLDVMAAGNLIWLLAAAMALTAVVACALMPLPPRPADAAAKGTSVGALLRAPGLLLGVAAASLIQASHAVYYGFSALEWKAAGLGGGTIGALWSIGVIAEIVLFALSGRFVAAPTTLLAIGAAGAVLRWGVMALEPPLVLLGPVQGLHALSFGATHLGAMALLIRSVPPALGATVQAYFAVALGLVMAAVMGLSGALYARWGGHAYLAMAIVAALGGACALVSRFRSSP
jgi:PPP family 3-phenylpropionic acid transporter